MFWAAMAFLRLPAGDAVLLNLLPIPGLDGYGALEPHLSPDTQRALAPAKRGASSSCSCCCIAPPLNQCFFAVVYWFVDLSGVQRLLVGDRQRLTRFWSAWL